MLNESSKLKRVEGEGVVLEHSLAPQGMITLRGDLQSKGVLNLCTDVIGAPCPARGYASFGLNGRTAIWMSPDELLFVLDASSVSQVLNDIDDALVGTHHLVVDVSDARAVFNLSGPGARDVLAKLTPVDLHPDVMKLEQVRRTKLGQVAAGFWLADVDSFDIICFRSVSDYMFELLSTSITAGPVGHFAVNE